MPNLDAVILAGGKSSRFGSIKSLHIVDGKPMIQHAVDCIEGAGADLVGIITSEDLLQPLSEFGPTLVDDIPDSGPIAGLLTAARIVTSDYFLVLPCDMPFVKSESLIAMASQCTQYDLTACVAADVSGRLSPLCGCYHQSIATAADKKLGSPDRSVHALLKSVKRVQSVYLAERELSNVNTLSDIRAGH
jgi:molybdopterin-guanine dinucleotide biosynthesis protein A